MLIASRSVELPPGSTESRAPLTALQTLAARTTGPPDDGAVLRDVGTHFGVSVAATGMSVAEVLAYGGTLRNTGTSAIHRVILRYVHLYTGSYSRSCDGAPSTGTHLSFGRDQFVVLTCPLDPRSALGRLGSGTC